MKKQLVRYPWDKWFRHRRFRLTRGADYKCMTHCMSVQVRAAAIKRGLRASVRFISANVLDVEVSRA